MANYVKICVNGELFWDMFGNVGELSMFGGALWRFGHCLKQQRAIKREFAGPKSSLRHSLDFSLNIYIYILLFVFLLAIPTI